MENFIIEFSQVLSPGYCEHIIQKFENSSQKTTGMMGSGVDKTKKDSTDLLISSQQDWVDECREVDALIKNAVVQYARNFTFLVTGAVALHATDPDSGRVYALTHEDVAKLDDEGIARMINTVYRFDDINLQHYKRGVGGYHHWHSEHYPHPFQPEQKTLRRVLLWLLYLNDVEEGGETDFFYQQVQIKPRQGSLILAPCSFTHTHRGAVPQSGDKYVMASWVMYATAAELYGK